MLSVNPNCVKTFRAGLEAAQNAAFTLVSAMYPRSPSFACQLNNLKLILNELAALQREDD